MGCDHCLHPLWAGIRCGVCGRWADEKEEPSEALKQAWESYRQALKDFDCPRCGHNCRREWQGLTDEEAAACWSTSAVETWKAIEAALKEKNK